jgi:hypothetical protein
MILIVWCFFPVLFSCVFPFFPFWCFFVSCVASPHCPILYTSLVTVGMMDGEGRDTTIGFLSFPINEDCVAASLFHKHKNTSLSPGVATKANLASGDG